MQQTSGTNDQPTDAERKRESLLRKIRALRQMTTERGASEAEAALAAQTLARLVAEHNVTDDELSLKRDAHGCVADALQIMRPTRPHWFCIGPQIGKLFKTRCWSSSTTEDILGLGFEDKVRNLHFYGFPADVAASVALADICSSAINTQGLAFAKTLGRKRSGKTRESFEIGMADRLGERIRELSQELPPTGTALIVLKDQLVTDEFAQYCKREGLSLGKARGHQGPVDPAAYQAGTAAANTVNLAPGAPIQGRHGQGAITAPSLRLGTGQ